jgi:hypothetical protein
VLDVADHMLSLFTLHKVANDGAREEWIFTHIRQWELWTHTGILPDPPEISGTYSDYEKPIVFISSIVH